MKEIFQGMKLRVGMDRTISWAPNKFAGNHGAQFKVIDNDGLVDIVLKKRPNGSNIKLNRDGEVIIYEDSKPVKIGKISSPPKINFEKLEPNPTNMVSGMMWVGPFDGEYHHFCESRFWLTNINRKRCHYKEVPNELKNKLERFKPTGGSFVVTPWGHVIALIEPQPLPKESRSQWENMSKEEKRLLQIKKAGAKMLPIYICQWKNDWKIELEDPIDYNKPLSQNEREEMMSFLSQFGMKDSSKDNINTTPSEPANVEEDFTDDDSFFADINDNIMITPSDDENNSRTQEPMEE